jgi:putative transposase
MPRLARVAEPGWVYHVMNRTVGKYRMFRTDADFEAFGRIMLEAYEREPMRILAYCLMGNHWHWVVWPSKEGQMSRFFKWLALTHAVRWRVAHRTVGYGHLYQGRFKAFPVQRDEHLMGVLRYVERNALSAGLVRRAEDWPWSSLWARSHGSDELKAILCDWPVDRPGNWIQWMNKPIAARELERLEISERRSRPYGNDDWVIRTAKRLGLGHTIRREGRPRKRPQSPP